MGKSNSRKTGSSPRQRILSQRDNNNNTKTTQPTVRGGGGGGAAATRKQGLVAKGSGAMTRGIVAKSSQATSKSCSNGSISHKHRVLIYSTCYNVLDGVTLTIRKLEQEILAAGHSVCILTTSSGDPANTHLDGTHPNRRVVFLDSSVPIPFLHNPDKPELSYQLGFSLSNRDKAQLDEFEPSIVHVTTPDCTCLHVIQYARAKEIPLMGTYHSNIPDYMDHYPGLSWLKQILGAFFAHQYGFLQSLFVPTPYIRKHLIDAYGMDSSTHLGVWGRGVDVKHYHPSNRSLKFRRSLGIADQTIVVCWVGRLVPEKRPDIFAKVVKRLHSLGLPFHALVVGAGPGEEEIKALPNTTFTGWMSPDQLKVAYASSDIFLFPSSVETFGNVTLEAAASGLPVVVEQGCSGHLVKHGKNGFSCPAGNDEAFFEATLKLVKDSDLRRSCGEASRSFSLTLEKTTVVRKMLDNYDKVTDDFYEVYGGLHENRDAIYTQLDGFKGGNFPRPLLLIVVEWLFVTIFEVVWKLTNFFYCLQKWMGLLPPKASNNKTVASEGCATNSVETKETSSVMSQSSGANTPSAPLSEGSSIVELTNMEIHTPDHQADDGSDSMGMLSQDNNQQQSSSLMDCHSGSKKALGDCELAHRMVSLFLMFVFAFCRLEGRLRQWFKSLSSTSTLAMIGFRKRKNSFDALDLETGWEETQEGSLSNEDHNCNRRGSLSGPDQHGPLTRRNLS